MFVRVYVGVDKEGSVYATEDLVELVLEAVEMLRGMGDGYFVELHVIY